MEHSKPKQNTQCQLPIYLLATDFTGDSKPDIAVGVLGSTTTGPVLLMPGDGQGHLGAALFTARTVASTGYWLASADLNGDGKPDLVIVDPVDDVPHGGAQVYINNGDGTFSEGQTFFHNDFLIPPPTPPLLAFSVALKDITGDGCVDAVLSDSYGDASIFANNCDGTFQLPASSQYALGDIGATIELADINHDGNLDIISSGVDLEDADDSGIADVAGNLVSVLLGDGTGHFGQERVYRGEPSMVSLAVGDLNDDGFPDILTANQGSNSVSVFINDGKGGFGDPQGEAIGYGSGITNSAASRLLFADVDGDGSQDIVVIQDPPLFPGTMQITTLLNDGTGKFSSPIQSPAWTEDQFIPDDFVLADFRNTGRPDLLVIGLDGVPTLFFAPNIGGGKFGPFTLTTPAGCSGVLAVGDFNGDGKLDFVTASIDTAPIDPLKLNVFLGNGDGTFRIAQTIGFEPGNQASSPLSVYAGDFNRDGKTDVLILDSGLYELLGNGDGTFQSPRTLFSQFGGFTLADTNRDGWPDLIALTDQMGTPVMALSIPAISVFIGQADGSFQFSQTYAPYLDSLQIPLLPSTAPPLNSFSAISGDFNGDGNPDVAILQVPSPGQTQNFFQILFGDGDGTFTPTYLTYPLNKLYGPQFAADLNGNGLSDLIELDNYTSSFNVIKSSLGSPDLQLEILTNPTNVSSGYGRVVLNTPATSATTILLTASDPNVTLPAVVIPAGNTSEDFVFTLGSGFNPHNVFAIQAQLKASTSTAFAYVAPTPSPVVELTPTALSFGNVNTATNSDPQQLTVRNIGGAPLIFTTINASSGYSETNDCGSSLAPGASCNINVISTGFVGSNQGGLNLVDNAGSQQAVLESFGTGLQFSPCCLFFSQPMGTASLAQTVTMTNQETIPLDITIAAPSSPQGFAQTNDCGTTLAPNASCHISVTFDPIQTGTVISTIFITDNSAFDGSYGIALTGVNGDFSLSSSSLTQTINAGQTATYDFTVSGESGYVGTVNLSCAGAPGGATCSVKPQTVSITSDSPIGFQVNVMTTARSSAYLYPYTFDVLNHQFAFWQFGWPMLLSGVFWIPQHRKRAVKWISLFLLLVLCSCGGGGASGGSGNGGGNGTNSGTLAGTYQLTITGVSGTVTHSTTLSLTVN